MQTLRHTVLFVCVHNSARSQMAETFLNELGDGLFEAESAGLEPGILNPYVVEAMRETGIDISRHGTQSVFDLYKAGRKYDVVVTVCDGASAESCPIFPGAGKRLAWSFPDPSKFTGTKEEILVQTRKVRDEIKEKVSQFTAEASELNYWLQTK